MKYKVGDKVRIKSIDWYKENMDEHGRINYGYAQFIPDMSLYCGEILTICDIEEDFSYYHMKECVYVFMDEMIECKVEEETKPKFKVGDEVRLKGTDIGGIIESIIRGQLIVNCGGSKIPAWPEDVAFIKRLVEEEKPLCEGCCSLELKYNKLTIADNICTDEVEIILQDYELKREGDKWFAIKKKKEYPKTCDECLEVLEYTKDALLSNKQNLYSYSVNLLADFQKLLICRDAYWKIAGEEMGLGKPWELSIGIPIYYIYYNRTLGTIKKDYADDIQGNAILAFPTAEMRDAFYENFKDLIEQCKELL